MRRGSPIRGGRAQRSAVIHDPDDVGAPDYGPLVTRIAVVWLQPQLWEAGPIVDT